MNRKDKLFEIEKFLNIPEGIRISYTVWKDGYNQFQIDVKKNKITFYEIISKKRKFRNHYDIDPKYYTIETLPTKWVLYIFDKGHVRQLFAKNILALVPYGEREKLWNVIYNAEN